MKIKEAFRGRAQQMRLAVIEMDYFKSTLVESVPHEP